MLKRSGFLVAFLVLLTLFTISCSGGVSSTSVGGAEIQIGSEIKDDFYIVSPKTAFSVDEDFYISFDNNAAFDSDFTTLKVEDTETQEIIAQIEYNVDPEWSVVITEMYSFQEPGKYIISFVVKEKVRASQEVIVSE